VTRAVVTGIGCMTPIGQDVGEFWGNLTSGRSGIRRISLFDPSDLDCQIAAEVKDWDPTRYMDAKVARRAARFSQFAVAAARQAVDDSGLRIDDSNRDDVAVVMNTGGGGVDVIVSGQKVFLEKGPSRVGPMTVPAMAPNMASAQVAMQLGTHGPTITSVAACAAGSIAPGAMIVAIETSKAQPAARLGDGVVVRVGDKVRTYDPALTAHVSAVAATLARRDRTFRFIRRLMPGGTCESTAYAMFGHTATGLCLPLANYHNMGRGGQIRPEQVHTGDFTSLVKLLTALAADRRRPADTDAELTRRLRTLLRTRRKYL